jgi:hypothetical protein
MWILVYYDARCCLYCIVLYCIELYCFVVLLLCGCQWCSSVEFQSKFCCWIICWSRWWKIVSYGIGICNSKIRGLFGTVSIISTRRGTTNTGKFCKETSIQQEGRWRKFRYHFVAQLELELELKLWPSKRRLEVCSNALPLATNSTRTNPRTNRRNPAFGWKCNALQQIQIQAAEEYQLAGMQRKTHASRHFLVWPQGLPPMNSKASIKS